MVIEFSATNESFTISYQGALLRTSGHFPAGPGVSEFALAGCDLVAAERSKCQPSSSPGVFRGTRTDDAAVELSWCSSQCLAATCSSSRTAQPGETLDQVGVRVSHVP
jgi:hypothetical protein